MADDKQLITAELLGVLGYTADMSRGEVLQRVYADTLKQSRQMVGLLLLATHFGDIAQVETMADQAQARVDALKEKAAQLEAAIEHDSETLSNIELQGRDLKAAAEAAARQTAHDAETAAALVALDASNALAAARNEAAQLIADGRVGAIGIVEQAKAETAAQVKLIKERKDELVDLEERVAKAKAALAAAKSHAASIHGI